MVLITILLSIWIQRSMLEVGFSLGLGVPLKCLFSVQSATSKAGISMSAWSPEHLQQNQLLVEDESGQLLLYSICSLQIPKHLSTDLPHFKTGIHGN